MISCNSLYVLVSNSSPVNPSFSKLYFIELYTTSPYNSVPNLPSILYGSGFPYQSSALVYTRSVTTLGQSRYVLPSSLLTLGEKGTPPV